MASISKELKEYGLIPKKKLGQHFLVDRNVLKKVLHTARVKKEDVVLEVGPGLGELTQVLACQARRVIAVEIDPRLAAVLEEKFRDTSTVKIVREDILKADFERLFESEDYPIKVVANLPYQISTPLLFRLIESREIFSTLTLMLQREVAERMIAPPGRKEYGPLSVFIQSFFDLSISFFVKPSAFLPPPRVESAVVHLSWKEKPAVKPEDEEWFKKVVRGSLGYRRKTLINALKHSTLPLPPLLEKAMEGIGIDPQRRPGTLSIEEFVRLVKVLKG
jgi:16S rRNA (adenine1518-N6/adenine1519-N6)-dimethyltransferase